MNKILRLRLCVQGAINMKHLLFGTLITAFLFMIACGDEPVMNSEAPAAAFKLSNVLMGDAEITGYGNVSGRLVKRLRTGSKMNNDRQIISITDFAQLKWLCYLRADQVQKIPKYDEVVKVTGTYLGMHQNGSAILVDCRIQVVPYSEAEKNRFRYR